jgi:DNA polymerase-3 subunit epsilon
MEMAEQPGLWEQNDLLGLLVSGPQQSSPQGDDPEHARSLVVAPLQTNGARTQERQPPAASTASEPEVIDSGNPESLASPFGLPQPAPQPIALPSLAPIARRSGPHAPGRILILDTETTGLSPEQGVCIEVGAVLFDVGSRAVLQQLSFLLPCQANPAEAINGIPAAVTRLPQPTEAALALFAALVAAADAVVAHHAAFDRQWFGHGALPALTIPWICSMEDIRWPAELQLRANPSLRDLALAHGVPVWAAHRALTDCDYLVHVFQRSAQLGALLVAAQEPRELYRARLSYSERHLAREAGFRWNEPVAGAWSRRLSKREAEALPFPVLPVERDGLAEAMAS